MDETKAPVQTGEGRRVLVGCVAWLYLQAMVLVLLPALGAVLVGGCEYADGFGGEVSWTKDWKGLYIRFADGSEGNWIVSAGPLGLKPGDSVEKPRCSFRYVVNGRCVISDHDVMCFLFNVPPGVMLPALVFLSIISVVHLVLRRRNFASEQLSMGGVGSWVVTLLPFLLLCNYLIVWRIVGALVEKPWP